MEPIRQVAMLCIGRAVMFGAIAIALIMLSFSFNPALAFRSGAITTMVMAGILTFKAVAAPSQNPKRTEVWLNLAERFRPRNPEARLIFLTILREVYGRFARASFLVACGFFAVSVALVALGFDMDPFAVATPVIGLARQ
ncbi:hypothetical protein [Nitratireductor arenosus]|uniref:hypothetical protein n=1 Tax=Nitratireductor arenosus TaxID=2682096 RepID=UPI0018D1FB9D|nr:hypothetical protein [Nitratireductor arenosus]